MLRAHPLGDVPRRQPVRRLVDEGGDAGLQQRYRSEAAAPRPLPLQQTDEDGLLELVRCEHVDESHGHFHRRAVRLAVHKREPALGLEYGVVACPCIVRVVADDVGVDQPWVERAERPPVRTESLRVARLVRGDDEVGVAGEVVEDALPVGRAEVERERLLAPVGGGEVGGAVGVSVLGGQLPAPRHVALRRRVLDLQHRRAELGEELADARPGEHARELYDDEVCERSGRGHADPSSS